MASTFRHIVIVPVALMFIVWLSSCQQAVPAGNDQRETTVTLVCEAPGWSSEEVESKVSVPLETALIGIGGLQRLSSVSRPAQAVIRVVFVPGIETLRARQIIAEQVNTVPLPDDVDVKLAPISTNEMLLIALRDVRPVDAVRAHDEHAGQLRDLAETLIRPRLLALAGVSEVVVAGGRRKQYQIFPSAEKLAAFDITPAELAAALRGRNTAVGESPVKANAEVLVRGVDQTQRLKVLADTVIKASSDGVPVCLKDVAEVQIGWVSDPARESAQGKQRDATEVQAVILAVQLQPDTDTKTINRNVNDLVRECTKQLPRGVKVQRSVDQRLERLVRDLAGKLQQELPPDVQLERRSTEQLGDVLAIAPTRPIIVKLYGPDLTVLRRKADEVGARIKEVPGVVNLRVHSLPDEPQLRIEVDRDLAARLGVTSRQVADAFSIAVGDHVVSKIREGVREFDLVMKRNWDNEARHVPIRSESGALVPIDHVAKITITAAPSAIYRDNGRRMTLISCDVKAHGTAEIAADIRKSFGPLPSGYFIDISH